jgi:hypothetical protein
LSRKVPIEFKDYLKRCIEELDLNPFSIKQLLIGRGFNCIGSWPAREKDNYVTHRNFVDELYSNDGESSLTVLKKFDYSNPDYIVEVGTHIGFFDVVSGRGSLFDMVLIKEFNLKYWNNSPDEGNGFSLKNYL